MDEPLVDRDGFPRADIDLYQVRIARNKIISEFDSGGRGKGRRGDMGLKNVGS